MNTLAMPENVVNEWAAPLTRCVSSGTVLRWNEPLAKRTTLRVGGPADLLAEPCSEQDLSGLLRFAGEHSIPLFVLGRGSNLLVRDGGVRGIVISLAHPNFSRVDLEGESLRCGAGARLKVVAAEAKRAGLAGLEFLEGIPGSIGGALRMNAGAMGSWMFDIVSAVRFMNREGQAGELPASEVPVQYRACPLFREHIALGAVVQGRPDSRDAIDQRMQAFSRKRWKSQPAAPSAGCMFKNPAEIPAGKLIEELGLKGTRVGGARVSDEHGNFIVNDGQATARDVLELAELIRERAVASRGIRLETEVEIIGEP
jgi:UDP-N-acetylenolpyruvoylglucosamine reductase